MQKRAIRVLVVGALSVGMASFGCGGSVTSSNEPVISDQVASTLILSSDEVVPTAPTYERDLYNLEAIVYRLRAAVAPLFQHYGLAFGGDLGASAAFKTMLGEVSFVADLGAITVTNKATGGVIFTGLLNNLTPGTFSPENIPGTTPTACTYTMGSWGECQSNGTQTRTVTASPAGCTGSPPGSSQPCTYVPPSAGTCTGFTYSTWAPAICPASGQQTRTILVSTPAGCTGGSPVLTQTCPPAAATCTSFTYSDWAPAVCPASGQQSRTVATSSPAGCTGGSPVLTQTCTPPPATCTSFTYSAWAPAACPASGQQSRTVATSSPAGCTGGSPVLAQACTPASTNPVTTANIVSSCTGCHGLTSNTTVFKSGGYSKSGASSATWLTTVNDMVGKGASLAPGTTSQNYADFLANVP